MWRTVTLIGVHLVMIAHVVQWLRSGITLSPVEPSEAMELAKHDVVNTGLVFFAAAIMVTAVLGRFFCGWGCHLIALQDLSRWLLIKIGVRPRPLRSRLLGLVPPVAFVYMFLWPAIHRLAVGDRFGPLRTGFTTSEFWATFPGLGVAVLTFAVCGFAAVLVLGSKGFCTYGCPYGAAFGVADRVAPVRVRVTDACRACATCTSVCTSNVRVHEEVRRHRMVVDPGCMKCLDCVAGCPNGALYVGFGRPAVGRGNGGRRRHGALSLSEELLAGLAFVLAFVVFRGLYGLVPFLFALGLAATLAALVVVLWRLLARPDVWFGPIRLKADRRVRRQGWLFAAVMAPVLLLWAHGAAVQLLTARAAAAYGATAELRRAALDLSRDPVPSAADDRRRVERARRAVSRLDRLSPVRSAATELELAWLGWLDGDREQAKARLDSALALQPGQPEGHLLAARILAGEGRTDESAAAFARAVELAPTEAAGYLGWGALLAGSGRLDAALEVFTRGLEALPGSADLHFNAGLALALTGDAEGAERHLREALERDPEHGPARENLAGVLAAAGRFAEAAPLFEEAVRRAPDDAELRVRAARAWLGAGRRDRAAEHLDAAVRLDPAMAPARQLLE